MSSLKKQMCNYICSVPASDNLNPKLLKLSSVSHHQQAQFFSGGSVSPLKTRDNEMKQKTLKTVNNSNIFTHPVGLNSSLTLHSA